MRKTKEEEEDRLRSENLEVDGILQKYDDDRFDRKQKIKVHMRPKIRNLFIFNLRKEEDVGLTNAPYYSVMKFIRVHITVTYTLEDDDISDIYMGSIIDGVIGESV